MSAAKRPPNELESKLHQTGLRAPKRELSAKQVEAIIPDVSARQDALNFLLRVGLLKSMVDAKGTVSFRAVTKEELMATKDLSVDENLVLGHIKGSGNEGIWTKHLKAKTNLHQTVIDRCLKTLTQKRLIKRVPSVQHPTRKIYMLEGLDPSVALTGGPWYTDNELDTEFIQHLTEACLKFIRDQTFPKRRSDKNEGALYALSNSPDYPTAEQIRNSLRKARLTETDLTVDHVEMLLNVLVLDGEVERLPSFGASMWNASMADEDSDDSDGRRKKKRRKEKESSSKRKRRALSSDGDSDSDSTSRKKAKRSRSKYASDSDADSDTQAKKNKKKRSRSDSEEDSGSESETASSKKSKKSRSKRAKDTSDDSSDESDDHYKKRKRSSSPMAEWDSFDTSGGGGYVYRAIRQERVTVAALEAPCSSCPSFEFCKEGGPVNPKSCVYYGDWLEGGTIAIEGEA